MYRTGSSICSQCCHFGVCSNNPRGRTIARRLKEELAEKLAVQYEQPDSQEIYKLRKQKVELPFGHIKHNLKVSGFLLRGIPGVKAEMSILSSCFNIARMISIIGVSELIARLGCWKTVRSYCDTGIKWWFSRNWHRKCLLMAVEKKVLYFWCDSLRNKPSVNWIATQPRSVSRIAGFRLDGGTV